MHIGGINIFCREAEKREQVRAVSVELFFRQAKPVAAKLIAKGPAAKDIANIKSFGQGAFDKVQFMGTKSAFFQARMIDALRAF